jgi:hypothetical protein
MSPPQDQDQHRTPSRRSMRNLVVDLKMELAGTLARLDDLELSNRRLERERDEALDCIRRLSSQGTAADPIAITTGKCAAAAATPPTAGAATEGSPRPRYRRASDGGASLLPGRLHVLSSFSSLQDEASTATSTAAQAQAEVGAAAHPLHVGRRHRADFAAFRELSSSDDDDEHDEQEHDDEHDDDEHDEVNAEHDDEHEHTVETLRCTSAGQPVLSTTTPSATTAAAAAAAAAQNAATETAGRSMLRRLSDGLTQRFHDSGCMARSMRPRVPLDRRAAGSDAFALFRIMCVRNVTCTVSACISPLEYAAGAAGAVRDDRCGADQRQSRPCC